MENLALYYSLVGALTIFGIVFLARHYGARGGNGILIFFSGVMWPITWLILVLLVIGSFFEWLIDVGR